MRKIVQILAQNAFTVAILAQVRLTTMPSRCYSALFFEYPDNLSSLNDVSVAISLRKDAGTGFAVSMLEFGRFGKFADTRVFLPMLFDNIESMIESHVDNPCTSVPKFVSETIRDSANAFHVRFLNATYVDTIYFETLYEDQTIDEYDMYRLMTTIVHAIVPIENLLCEFDVNTACIVGRLPVVRFHSRDSETCFVCLNGIHTGFRCGNVLSSSFCEEHIHDYYKLKLYKCPITRAPTFLGREASMLLCGIDDDVAYAQLVDSRLSKWIHPAYRV